jgi:hypothetical protein
MIKIPAVHAGVISGIKIANRDLSPCSLLSRSPNLLRAVAVME